MDLYGSDALIRPLLTTRFVVAQENLAHTELAAYVAEQILQLPQKPRVIALMGGAACGKSTLSAEVVANFRARTIAADVILIDTFNKGDRTWRHKEYEGDQPAFGETLLEKFDRPLLKRLVDQVKANTDPAKTVAFPVYDEQSGLAADAGQFPHQIGPVEVLIVEGDFYLLDECDLLIYLHLNDEQRLQNRITRDQVQRNEPDAAKIKASFELRQRIQHFSLTLPTASKAQLLIVATLQGSEYRYAVYTRRTS